MTNRMYTEHQYEIVDFIRRHGGRSTVSAISSVLCIDYRSLTGEMRRLRENGIIIRVGYNEATNNTIWGVKGEC